MNIVCKRSGGNSNNSAVIAVDNEWNVVEIPLMLLFVVFYFATVPTASPNDIVPIIIIIRGIYSQIVH